MSDAKEKQEGPEQGKLVAQMREVLELYGIAIEPNSLEDDEASGVDYEEVLAKTQDKIEDLNAQADQIASNLGMSRDDLETYANNPDNFTQEQWELLQRVRSECDQFKERTIASIEEITSEEAGDKEPEEKAPKKAQKKPKKKKLGKKKKWLQL